MKLKSIALFMDIAQRVAKESYSNRRKVGVIIVKNDSIISIGYNGTSPGDDNCCEHEDGRTKPEVIHSEMNAIAKLAKSTMSGDGATLFCTLQPCLECAKLIVVSGIKEVYYAERYFAANGGNGGLEYLQDHGIFVALVTMEDTPEGRAVFLII